jgi:hypothetical protein
MRATIQIPACFAPSGIEAENVALRVLLVDASNRPIVGVADAQGVIGASEIPLTGVSTEISLATNDSILPENTRWQIQIMIDGQEFAVWHRVLESDIGLFEWLGVVS